MDTFTLTRTGKRPLTFDGELIAATSSDIIARKRQNRWHELALYRTQAGTYLVHVGYRTQWEKELDYDLVEELPDPDALEGFLALIDPCEHMAEMPGGSQFDRKREFRQQALERNFQHIVSELLAVLPEQID